MTDLALIFRDKAIRLSLWATKVDKFIRKLKGNLGSSADIDRFIEERGLGKSLAPHDIYNRIRGGLTWREDKDYFGIPMDYAKCPEAFVHDKCDDCDGFAMFYEEILNRVGYGSDVFRVYVMTKQGHVICTVRQDGYTWGMGNWPLFQLSSDGLRDIGMSVSLQMGGDLDYAAKFKYDSFLEGVA